MPTMSAPAASASSALARAGANTATRTLLPVPAGSTVEPRTCWSDLRASTPRRTATSTDSTNLARAVFLMIWMASSKAYALPGTTAALMAFLRLFIAMASALHRQAHRTGGTRDGAHGRVQVGSGQVGFLRLGDLLELGAGDLAHLLGVRALGTALHAGRLLEQDRGGRGLGDEGEGTVRVGRDHGRDRQARLHLLRGGVERLAELHDVQATLAQRRADRRRRVGLAGLDLQLDVADYFLCHLGGLSGCERPVRAPHRAGRERAPASRRATLRTGGRAESGPARPLRKASPAV